MKPDQLSNAPDNTPRVTLAPELQRRVDIDRLRTEIKKIEADFGKKAVKAVDLMTKTLELQQLEVQAVEADLADRTKKIDLITRRDMRENIVMLKKEMNRLKDQITEQRKSDQENHARRLAEKSVRDAKLHVQDEQGIVDAAAEAVSRAKTMGQTGFGRSVAASLDRRPTYPAITPETARQNQLQAFIDAKVGKMKPAEKLAYDNAIIKFSRDEGPNPDATAIAEFNAQERSIPNPNGELKRVPRGQEKYIQAAEAQSGMVPEVKNTNWEKSIPARPPAETPKPEPKKRTWDPRTWV